MFQPIDPPALLCRLFKKDRRDDPFARPLGTVSERWPAFAVFPVLFLQEAARPEQ